MTANDNHKIRAPGLAVTKEMVEAGKAILTKMVDKAEDMEDDALVAGIFFEMWTVYWGQIEETRRRKTAGGPIVQLPKPKLILPT